MTQETIQKITGGEKLQSTVSSETFEKLEGKVSNLAEELKEAKENFEKSRFDLITTLTVFVGLITYLGLEIQVFKEINNPLLIIGTSIFFIASILLFILTINIILKKTECIAWRDLKNPLNIILIILLVTAIIFITYGYHDYTNKNAINTRISICYGS